MDLQLAPISIASAHSVCEAHGQKPLDTCEGFAISVAADGVIHGVIMMNTKDAYCRLHHLYTDGTALVGSLLYGAAWRAAKALGYKTITI